jgi:MFS family permease
MLRLPGRVRLGPLHERPFRALYLAHAVSVLGDGLAPVALAFAVLDLTGSASDLGLVMLARLVPMVLLFLAGGVWADRLPRHRVMVGSHLVCFASQGLTAALLLGGVATLRSLVVLQALGGAAIAFHRPASNGLVPRLVPAAQLQQANALMWMAISVGGVLGPVAAGLLVTGVGAGWAIAGDALTFLLAAVLLLRLGGYDLGLVGARSSFWRDLADGWGEVRRRTWLWSCIAYFALFQLVYLPCLAVLGPLVAKRSLGGAEAWAEIVAGFGVGAVLGNLLAIRIRVRRPLVAQNLLMFGAVPSLLLLAVTAPAPAIAATEVLSGTVIGLGGALWETTLQRHVPAESLSRVASYDWMGSTALRPVGLAVVGPVAVLLGTGTTLVAAAAVVVAGALLVASLPDVRRIRGAAREPEAEQAQPPVPAAVSG